MIGNGFYKREIDDKQNGQDEILIWRSAGKATLLDKQYENIWLPMVKNIAPKNLNECILSHYAQHNRILWTVWILN